MATKKIGRLTRPRGAPSRETVKKKAAAARKALEDIGLNVSSLNLVEKNGIYNIEYVRIHEVDRTPQLSETLEASTATCLYSNGIDVGGKSRTDASGTATVRLSSYVCVPGLETGEPVSFVATARSRNPVVMTFRTVSTGDDLALEVFSWDAAGNPAPRVDFAWRCWTQSSVAPYPPVE